ncbi:hypothetical protein O0L34_g427 [Tuta absoluta]|nr:hypothetical protein O0L34_g427 [Tuta absoluta]
MRRHPKSDDTAIPEEDVEKEPGKELPRKGSLKYRQNVVQQYVVDYTANSNLHGLKYIGEKQRTSVEKVFWLFMFICSVVLCSGLIRKLWIKWNESPVIVSFAESTTPVWQIPYPAVTICFETKAMQTKFNFTDYYHKYLNETINANLTTEEKNMFEDVSLVCDDHLAPPNGRETASGADTVSNLRSVSPNMTDVFFGCKYKDNPQQTCEDLFVPILTEEGQCYTFNTLGAQDLFRLENLHDDYEYLESRVNTTGWTLDDGYEDKTQTDTYPHKGLGYGVRAGIVFLMKANEVDLDYLCKGPVQGFKILLHNPAELPRLSQQYFRSPLSQEVVVAVKPKMMTTSDGLIPYEPSRRQCYFQNERYLQYFKVYTQANCEMECLTNFTFTRCGCVHFGVPHGPNMPVCNAGKIACLKKAQMDLVMTEAQMNLDEEEGVDLETLRKAREVALQCKCLPACTSIEYESETSQADYNWKEIFKAYKLDIPEDEVNLKYSRVMVFFKEAQFITSRRSELYGQTDFLANCGGLLGLFLGFSILSVVEILYFLTLRIVCVWWRRRQAKKLKTKSFPKTALSDIASPKPTKAYID